MQAPQKRGRFASALWGTLCSKNNAKIHILNVEIFTTEYYINTTFAIKRQRKIKREGERKENGAGYKKIHDSQRTPDRNKRQVRWRHLSGPLHTTAPSLWVALPPLHEGNSKVVPPQHPYVRVTIKQPHLFIVFILLRLVPADINSVPAYFA